VENGSLVVVVVLVRFVVMKMVGCVGRRDRDGKNG
jgi:hypothetical protein